MTNVAGKMFMLVFLIVAVVGFVGVVALMERASAPVDATIQNTTQAYYDASQYVNQSINQTMHYAGVGIQFNSALPLFMAICVLACGLFVFLLVVKGGKKR